MLPPSILRSCVRSLAMGALVLMSTEASAQVRGGPVITAPRTSSAAPTTSRVRIGGPLGEITPETVIVRYPSGFNGPAIVIRFPTGGNGPAIATRYPKGLSGPAVQPSIVLQPEVYNLPADSGTPLVTVVQITALSEGPAAKAGLKVNDIILEVDGARIKTFDDLRAALKASKGKSMFTIYSPGTGIATKMEVSVVDSRIGATVNEVPATIEDDPKPAPTPSTPSTPVPPPPPTISS